MSERSLTDEDLTGLWRGVKRASGPFNADDILRISKAERKDMFKQVKARWERNRLNLQETEKPAITTRNAFDTYNNITTFAKGVNYSISADLERIAGRMLELGGFN